MYGCSAPADFETDNSAFSGCSPLLITAVTAPNGAFNIFTKQVDILGVAQVFAESSVPDEKVLHSAGVLAQYLDNNGDGSVDSPEIEQAMKASSPFPTVVMFNNMQSRQEEIFRDGGGYGQPLYGEEVHPEGTTAAIFDATVEETLHLVYDNGFAKAWPSIFGAYRGTAMADMMDKTAADGYYTGNPEPSIDNRDYATQMSEFHYWNITSILGMQAVRANDISFEWRLASASAILTAEPASYLLFTNAAYGMPTTAPDGSYCR